MAGKRSINVNLTIPEVDDGQTRTIEFLPHINMQIDADYETIDALVADREPVKKVVKMVDYTSFIIDSKRPVKDPRVKLLEPNNNT